MLLVVLARGSRARWSVVGIIAIRYCNAIYGSCCSCCDEVIIYDVDVGVQLDVAKLSIIIIR
jgi:hypothetical protein